MTIWFISEGLRLVWGLGHARGLALGVSLGFPTDRKGTECRYRVLLYDSAYDDMLPTPNHSSAAVDKDLLSHVQKPGYFLAQCIFFSL